FYKFTNLERFFESFRPESGPETVDISRYQDEFLPTFVFVDGELKSSPEVPGLTFKLTAPESLEDGNALSELHHDLAQKTLLLKLAKNQKPESAVRVLHLMTRADIRATTL